jgi:hypothetical protein
MSRRKGRVRFGSAVIQIESSLIAKTRQYDQYGRLLADKGGGGRPRNFDDAVKTNLMDRLEPYLLKRQVELGRLPYRKDEKVLKFVRGLVEVAGLDSSDDINTKQLIDPALRKLRDRKRRGKNF